MESSAHAPSPSPPSSPAPLAATAPPRPPVPCRLSPYAAVRPASPDELAAVERALADEQPILAQWWHQRLERLKREAAWRSRRV